MQCIHLKPTTLSPLVFPYFLNGGHINKLQYCFDGVAGYSEQAFIIASSIIIAAAHLVCLPSMGMWQNKKFINVQNSDIKQLLHLWSTYLTT